MNSVLALGAVIFLSMLAGACIGVDRRWSMWAAFPCALAAAMFGLVLLQ